MTAANIGGGSTGRTSAALGNIGRESFIMSVMLVVQYGLGIGVNLYVTLPAKDHGGGVGKAISNGPLSVSLHAILGLALIVVAVALAAYAIRARHVAIIALAIVGLVALIVAGVNGNDFVSNEHNGPSMGMAMAWAVALLSYLGMLFVVSRAGLSSDRGTAPV
jgi:hypothetical protein